MSNMFMFVLFLDLEKTFDYIIREFLLGLPRGHVDPQMQHFLNIGLGQETTQELLNGIAQHGSVLYKLGVDPKVAALVNSLHTNTWFRYEDLQTIIVTSKGGRQGCKLGAIIFNMVYARALTMLRTKLEQHGIILQVRWNYLLFIFVVRTYLLMLLFSCVVVWFSFLLLLLVLSLFVVVGSFVTFCCSLIILFSCFLIIVGFVVICDCWFIF
ncbi:unnamed protein product [Polarella glacialis]|uniref:Reverse transcriptase domain-containing protein n=1 Tax=Polarella glacialis TaxID=89957 RepID=A0A813L0P1_POLGL|nr:unnamed protein product [Polarella glacialis]